MPKKQVKEIAIDKEWCKGCGICIHFCPKNTLRLSKDSKSEVVDLKTCIGCRLCELRCPDFASEVKFKNNE